MTDKYEDEVIQEEDHENKDENRRGPEKFCSLCPVSYTHLTLPTIA